MHIARKSLDAVLNTTFAVHGQEPPPNVFSEVYENVRKLPNEADDGQIISAMEEILIRYLPIAAQ